MRKLILICGVLALAACKTDAPNTGTTPVSSLPGASVVCTALNSSSFDTALKAYGAATDAVNLLIDVKVITPGSARAVAIADANDKILAGFAAAQAAYKACNADSYTAALDSVRAGIADLRTALHK